MPRETFMQRILRTLGQDRTKIKLLDNAIEKKPHLQQPGTSMESTKLSEEGNEEDEVSDILSTTTIGYKQPERIFQEEAAKWLLDHWYFRSVNGPQSPRM